MLKAVFIDYTGTTVTEGEEKQKQCIKRICDNSRLHNHKEMIKIWWDIVKKWEESSYQESYLTEDEILDKTLDAFVEEYELCENLEELKELVRICWSEAPIFPDAKLFYEKCPLPIYVITNNGIQYVSKAMDYHDLHPAGIVSADMVKAYKPRRELFEKALEMTGCRAEEVIHIGDSYTSDVQGARNAGIKPILVQRTGNERYEEDLVVVKELTEILDLLEKNML